MAKRKSNGHGLCAKCGKPAEGSHITRDTKEQIGACAEHMDTFCLLLANAGPVGEAIDAVQGLPPQFDTFLAAMDIAARMFRGVPEDADLPTAIRDLMGSVRSGRR